MEKHKCGNWQCDFCEAKTCIGCGGTIDEDGNCACKTCKTKHNIKNADFNGDEW